VHKKGHDWFANSLHHGIWVPSCENIKQQIVRFHLLVPQWQLIARVEVSLHTIGIYLQHN
jgi:hypothetical protein